jgi:hypothetical protein
MTEEISTVKRIRPNSGRRIATLAAILLAVVLTSFVVAALPGSALADADTTAPDPPNEVFVDQGTGWLAENHFDVWWHIPAGQQSPVVVAHYQLCPAVPLGPCTTSHENGAGISQMSVTLPYAGFFWLRVWLEDGAGNVNPSATSPAVMLRFDDGKPPVAFLRHSDSWLGDTTPASPAYIAEIDAGAELPLSGIRGYSITVDGTVPDDNVDAFAAQDYEGFRATYVMQSLAEGTTTVRLRTVSNAGVPSEAIGTAYVRLDRTPPVLTDGGLPVDSYWYRDSLLVSLEAVDQENLSGMSPAPPDSSPEAGAHIAYELDDGSTQRLRGDRAEVAVETDGRHTLRYRAFDAAGNGSVEKEVGFKIDGTAPVGTFRALDPGDPRALRVDVADATSGVADGRIEYRRDGDAGFRRLATVRAGGVLNARLDDQDLAPGRYEVRAVVTDVAGNEAVVNHWADGSRTTLAMPLRLAANMSVAGTVKARGCGKAAKKRRGSTDGRKRAARPKCRQKKKAKSVTTLGLRYGKRTPSSGRLATAQGAPIANAPIIVEGQARSGGPFVKLGAARTDARGSFRFTVPAGPSRTIRYRYEGTNTVQPTAAQLTTKVAAAARLKVDRRRLRNGQAVRFTGRLLGKPIPKAGKLVALQAKVGRGWRTFATPRANKKGIFRHRYRFTATTGMRRYKFRAVVEREDAYPYEAGVSRIVRVIVRGR